MTRTTQSSPLLLNLGSVANNGQGTTLRDGGVIINENFTDLYTAVNAVVDYVLPIASTTSLGGVKVDGSTITIDGTGVIKTGSVISPAAALPIIDGVASVGTSLLYAREDHVHPASITSSIPSGIIVMWSGATTAVPTGWLLCDGTNGTPNLRDRFVVGAGTTYTVSQTGGNANAAVISHSHTLTAATFTGSAMTPHTHTDSGHSHAVDNVGTTSNPLYAWYPTPNYIGTGNTTTQPGYANISSNSAGTPAGTIGGATDTTGSSGVGANLPPFFALAYIMKQ